MPAACICEGTGLAQAIREDVDRYVYHLELEGRTGWLVFPRIAVLSPGLTALIAYRLTHFALHRIKPRPLSVAAGTLGFLFQRIILALSGIEIDVNAHIGPGLVIPHAGTMVIGAGRIGRNCVIAHGVTLGRTTILDGGKPLEGPTPTLGDRIWIGPGAVIAGDVKVGSDAVVGANSVLLRDVPPRAVVLGIPARIVSWRGSFSQVWYRGMNDDPDRAESLAQADPAQARTAQADPAQARTAQADPAQARTAQARAATDRPAPEPGSDSSRATTVPA
jgi:serine O-acetyltransferase